MPVQGFGRSGSTFIQPGWSSCREKSGWSQRENIDFFFFLLGIAFAAFFMRFHMLQPPASDRPRPPLAHPGSVSGREDIPVPIPSRPVHPPPLLPAPGGETSALPGEDMEKTPKILCSLWERSDRLDGSKAPGQAAAGAGRGVLGDPCAHKPGAWAAARPGVGVCVCVCGASGDLLGGWRGTTPALVPPGVGCAPQRG